MLMVLGRKCSFHETLAVIVLSPFLQMLFPHSFSLFKESGGWFLMRRDCVSFPKSTRGAWLAAWAVSCPFSFRQAWGTALSSWPGDLGRDWLLDKSCSQWTWSTQSGQGLLNPGRCREGLFDHIPLGRLLLFLGLAECTQFMTNQSVVGIWSQKKLQDQEPIAVCFPATPRWCTWFPLLVLHPSRCSQLLRRRASWVLVYRVWHFFLPEMHSKWQSPTSSIFLPTWCLRTLQCLYFQIYAVVSKCVSPLNQNSTMYWMQDKRKGKQLTSVGCLLWRLHWYSVLVYNI